MRSLVCFVCLVFLAACSKPAGVYYTEALQAEVERIREQYGFPGITAAYVLNDGTEGAVASGWADVEARQVMTERTRMLGASTGKSFIAALAIALVREGRLALDDPVSRWLGKYDWFKRLPNHDSITVQHLLTHSAGLPDHVYTEAFHKAFAREWREYGNPFPPQRLVGYILDEPAKFPAGSAWAYSDTGYILLGMVLGEVTGHPCFAEIEKRFLRPLRLVDTAPADQRNLNRLATGYMNPENPFGLPARTLNDKGHLYWHPGVEWAGGGLVTTSRDLAHWASALFTGKALPGRYLPELLKGVSIDPSSPVTRYAAGVVASSDERYGPVYGHSGWIPGYVSSFRYYNDSGVSIAFQINTDIGIMDSNENIVKVIEGRLVKTLIDGAEKR